MVQISIVIPAYNEEKRIERMLKSYSDYFGQLAESGKLQYELLVVINNTTDRTEEIVNELRKGDMRIGYINLKSGGKGLAVIEGFRNALKRNNDLIGFADADMATSPESFYYLVSNIGNSDGAIADRYLKESEVYPPVTFRRVVVSRIFNFFTRTIMFLPYRDTQCGAKIFKRQAIEKIIADLSMSQWAFDVELLYLLKKKRFKVVPLPTIWTDREYSKINFLKSGPLMALAILRLRLLNSVFKNFVCLYDKTLGKRVRII